jgi:hypothetical protein
VKARLVPQGLITDPMNFESTRINFAIRVNVMVPVIIGNSTIDQFNAANFDDTMIPASFETCSFGIEYNLPHDFPIA